MAGRSIAVIDISNRDGDSKEVTEWLEDYDQVLWSMKNSIRHEKNQLIKIYNEKISPILARTLKSRADEREIHAMLREFHRIVIDVTDIGALVIKRQVIIDLDDTFISKNFQSLENKMADLFKRAQTKTRINLRDPLSEFQTQIKRVNNSLSLFNVHRYLAKGLIIALRPLSWIILNIPEDDFVDFIRPEEPEFLVN